MATSRNKTYFETAKVQHIINEFFGKCLHIILEARCTCHFSGSCCGSDVSAADVSISSIKRRDNSFNLTLKECPSVLKNLNFWMQTDLDFLAVDVILKHNPPHPGLACPSSDDGSFIKTFSQSEKIVERWIVQYEPWTGVALGKDSGVQGKRRIRGRGTSCEMFTTPFKKIYKSSISLLRSLYATLRLLPTHKLFRDLKSSGRKRLLKLSHNISCFVEPFSHSEDAEMREFGFTPVDTPYGQLCLSVSYLPRFEYNSLELTIPISTTLITDYFRSPLADPVRTFESLSIGSTVCHDVHFPSPPSSETTKCPHGRDLKMKQPENLKSSNFLPEMNLQKALSSRGSGAWSFLDEWDAFDMLPFSKIIGDDIRTEIFSGKEDLWKSSVSVGILTQMLRTAPPLRQDTSESKNTSISGSDEGIQSKDNLMSRAAMSSKAAGKRRISSPRLLKSRTVDDALLELKNYQEMVGLRQSNSSGDKHEEGSTKHHHSEF